MNSQGENEHSSYSAPVVGFALLVHGLNTRPSSLSPLQQELHRKGIHVTPVTLSGHQEFTSDASRTTLRARRDEFRAATRECWHADIERGFEYMTNIAQGAPRFFVAYSLGALLGLELILARRMRFERMVLFAPAVAMHRRNNLLRLFRPIANLILPSFMPKRIRVHGSTPLSAYLELFRSVDALHAKHDIGSLDIPTRVYADPRDELVSTRGIEQWVSAAHFTQWRVESVATNAMSLRSGCFHHLITDPDCMDAPVWQRMMASMTEFLTAPRSGQEHGAMVSRD